MSKAFKCDRCKTCFDPWETGDEKLEFGNISEYMTLTPVGGSFDFTYRDEGIHFCPKCNLEFARFMNNQCVVGGLPIFTDLFNEIEQLKSENNSLRLSSEILKTQLANQLRKNCNASNEKDGV